ncbi:hypothetical protein KIN20_004718 [Parelaphostrongylus tenuis]|uniref:Secreted protein n=1 Tax=Parelaphostrongylus tenuis TaxID=148309 RepID=A0AAD5QFD0_PARTN|nr:hypothetical protein KIN20_004718 [Parelaphostrongylus tenuis]
MLVMGRRLAPRLASLLCISSTAVLTAVSTRCPGEFYAEIRMDAYTFLTWSPIHVDALRTLRPRVKCSTTIKGTRLKISVLFMITES